MAYGVAVAICVGLVLLVRYLLNKFFPRLILAGNAKANRNLTPQLLANYNARHINAIVDQFNSVGEVSKALREAGLESSNLIIGIDFTASNLTQGEFTFHGKSLHAIQSGLENPYEMVIRILGETLERYDEDNIIPAFGFGDTNSRDRTVFSLRLKGYCDGGFKQVLEAYRNIAPTVKLSGPTSFAPLIYQAIDIVKATQQYHILIIIADGQVTSEQSTMKAIVDASSWPLSIVMVGVGDGPWGMMCDFDDKLPTRKFDNFQFVDLNKVLTYGIHPEAAFALHALMEIPDQFAAIRELGLLEF